jgi:hypothetical protein
MVWLLGGCCLSMGCVPPKVQTQSAPQFDPARISRIAVLPFQAIQTPQWGSRDARGGIRDPEEIRTQFRLPGTDQVNGRESRKDLYVVPETAARRVTAMVVSALMGRPSLRVFVPIDTSGLLETDDRASVKSTAQEVGKRLQVDGVVTGLVRTFRQREGSKLGAQPAAVGFDMYLVRPSDGTVLWTGEFYEEQKPLTQDLVGFFEAGGFVTAEELAELGVRKVMKAFPVGLANDGSHLSATSSKETP